MRSISNLSIFVFDVTNLSSDRKLAELIVSLGLAVGLIGRNCILHTGKANLLLFRAYVECTWNYSNISSNKSVLFSPLCSILSFTFQLNGKLWRRDFYNLSRNITERNVASRDYKNLGWLWVIGEKCKMLFRKEPYKYSLEIEGTKHVANFREFELIFRNVRYWCLHFGARIIEFALIDSLFMFMYRKNRKQHKFICEWQLKIAEISSIRRQWIYI